MLARVLKNKNVIELLTRQTGPALLDAVNYHQSRGIRLLEIFSKERRAQRKRKLREEIDRGYFDDFREFRDSKGKVFRAPERLIPASAAPAFPAISPRTKDDATQTFPPPAGPSAPHVSLACVAFRAGAQEMLEAWAMPFSQAHQGDPRAALYELALVESWVMRLWPFRSMLMANGTSEEGKYAMSATYLHLFEDLTPLQSALHLTNRLTGYVFLLDGEGRVRWRGSGHPDPAEVELLLCCSRQLLDEAEKAELTAAADAGNE